MTGTQAQCLLWGSKRLRLEILVAEHWFFKSRSQPGLICRKNRKRWELADT